jgi:hypothetical protein
MVGRRVPFFFLFDNIYNRNKQANRSITMTTYSLYVNCGFAAAIFVVGFIAGMVAEKQKYRRLHEAKKQCCDYCRAHDPQEFEIEYGLNSVR